MLLDRYIFKELLPPFFFGLAMFTILYLATGPIFDMANLVIQYGVPVFLVLKYALVRLPSFIAYTVPMSVLLATLVAFGRLSVDQEIIAMKASGISFYRILLPVFLFALGATFFSYVLNAKIGPESLYKARVFIRTHESEGRFPSLENIKLTTKTNEGLLRVTIAQSFNEETGIMYNPVIDDYSNKGGLLRITHAKQALWKNNAWILVSGETFQFDEKGALQSRLTFPRADLNLPQTPQEISLLQRSPEEMDNALLQKTITLLLQNPFYDKQEVRSLWTLYRLRQALPFACLVFAFVGAPSGIRPIRSTSSAGVALSVFIILIYYFFVAVFKSLGDHDVLSAMAAAWIPNLIFLVVGFFFLLKETT